MKICRSCYQKFTEQIWARKKKIESMFAKWRCEGGKMPFLSRCLKISLTDILRTFFACSCFRLRILRFSSKYPNASKISCSSIFSPSLFFICCSFEADLIYALHIYAFCLEYAIHQQISGYQKSTENGKKSSSFRGAKLWNSLSANCKQAASLSTFKQYIQRCTFTSYLFLFSYSFKGCNFVFKVTFVFRLLLFSTLLLYI